MALEIRWTTRADIKLDYQIIYLKTEWGESVVKTFMIKLYDFLEILSEFPEKNISGFTLTKQINVFYKMKAITLYCLTYLIIDRIRKRKTRSNIR